MTTTEILNDAIRLHIAATKTRQEICNEYKMSYKVFKRKMKFHNIQLPPGMITPKYQYLIYDILGLPPTEQG